MVPESVLSATTGAVKLSYWLVRRGAWVVATTAALAFLPALIEQQRLEAEEFDLARKKQMMFGEGAVSTPHSMGLPLGRN
eukprot:Em0020g494a